MPSRLNEQGKPARIAIHTDDQKEYQIDFSGAGKELLNLTYKKVSVQGKLREQLNGRPILRRHLCDQQFLRHLKISQTA